MDPTLLIKKEAQRYTLGVVYEPDVTDTQGEFAKADAIESAAWNFLAQLQEMVKSAGQVLSTLESAEEGTTIEVQLTEAPLAKGGGLDDQHLQLSDELGTIVESYLAPCDLVIDGQTVKKGAWLLGVRWTEDMWKKIVNGERTGLSMYGIATRVKE